MKKKKKKKGTKGLGNSVNFNPMGFEVAHMTSRRCGVMTFEIPENEKMHQFRSVIGCIDVRRNIKKFRKFVFSLFWVAFLECCYFLFSYCLLVLFKRIDQYIFF